MNRIQGRLANIALVIVSVAISLGTLEVLVRYLPQSDKMGWSMVPPVDRRVTQVKLKQPGRMRILALGDSQTEWRDATGYSWVRVAERRLRESGREVEMVNLAEGGTGFKNYLGNFLRHEQRLEPDLVLIGVFLGNDLRPSSPPLSTPEGKASAVAVRPEQNNTFRELMTGVQKNSVLLNYCYRLAKYHVPSLRVGTFEQVTERVRVEMGADRAFVESRLAAVNPRRLDAARADMINPWLVVIGMLQPDYYSELAAAQSESAVGNGVERGIEDLQAIIRAVHERNIEAAVVLLPSPVWVSERYWPFFREIGYRNLGPVKGPLPLIEQIRRSMAPMNVRIIDVLAELRAVKDNIYIPNDDHPDREGHRVIGETVAAELLRSGPGLKSKQ